MRELPSGLAAHLATGATTLAWCWRITRRDGVVQGFTDHDRALAFEGTVFEAASGLEASELRASVGLSVDNLEVAGALSSEALSEEDLMAGIYDDAKVEIWRVNWSAPDERLLMRTGSLGEVRRTGTAFTAEIRGLQHYLQETRGRSFQFTCDADLGDLRCGVDLSLPVHRGEGVIVASIDDRRFVADGLSAYAAGAFSRGLARFTTGPASGQAVEVRQHLVVSGEVRIELWQAPRGPLLSGQAFVITAGCDKHLSTCRDRFVNTVNFRGFPHMPGNDFLTAVSRPGSKAR